MDCNYVSSYLGLLTALPPGVGEESSGCSALEGLLKKKNSSGQWKERYGLMNNNFFLTYKPKGNAPSSELKESVDLKKMQSVAPIGADNFVIIMQDGERLEFQGVKRDEWLDVIRERADWAVGKTTTSSSIAMPSFPSLEGTIKKKNSHGQFKDRYCVVSATKFVGYMLKGSQRTDETKENFDLRDLVNVSLQGDCFEMELKNGETMVFKAAKPRDWVDGIQMRVDYLAQMMPGPPVDSSPAIGNLERRGMQPSKPLSNKSVRY